MRSPLGLLGWFAAAMLLVGTAQAQTKTVTPQPTPVAPFQKVQVGDFAYQVDPYYPGVLTLTKRVEELSGPSVVSSTVTFQPFLRVGDQMTAQPAFDTHDSDLISGLKVGSSLICAPQEAQP
jgi:hypothetical protein